MSLSFMCSNNLASRAESMPCSSGVELRQLRVGQYTGSNCFIGVLALLVSTVDKTAIRAKVLRTRIVLFMDISINKTLHRTILCLIRLFFWDHPGRKVNGRFF